jgi:hypothetical protein
MPPDVPQMASVAIWSDEPDSDGTNIRGFEKAIVKQYPTWADCFLSLRQIFPETWACFEPENDASGLDGFASRSRLPSHRDFVPE